MVTVVKEDSSSSALAVVLVLLAVAAIGFCVYFFGTGKLGAPASNTTINLPNPPAVNNTTIKVPEAPALPTPSGGDTGGGDSE